jgi:hypothetical protein
MGIRRSDDHILEVLNHPTIREGKKSMGIDMAD